MAEKDNRKCDNIITVVPVHFYHSVIISALKILKLKIKQAILFREVNVEFGFLQIEVL